MELPWGATENDFEKCKTIIFELTGVCANSEVALGLLNVVYAHGGDYAEKTLRTFAKGYLKKHGQTQND